MRFVGLFFVFIIENARSKKQNAIGHCNPVGIFQHMKVKYENV